MCSSKKESIIINNEEEWYDDVLKYAYYELYKYVLLRDKDYEEHQEGHQDAEDFHG